MVIIGAMVVYHLPGYMAYSRNRSHLRDAAIALLFGSFMTVMVLKTGSVTPSEKISDYFTTNSAPMAYGNNIVNVILVDFRALDTFGEIMVLVIAAIGVVALLKVKSKKEDHE
jgi:multicomponent Na+:H+ antiporter subunit A